jgi:hypothetical protein
MLPDRGNMHQVAVFGAMRRITCLTHSVSSVPLRNQATVVRPGEVRSARALPVHGARLTAQKRSLYCTELKLLCSYLRSSTLRDHALGPRSILGGSTAITTCRLQPTPEQAAHRTQTALGRIGTRGASCDSYLEGWLPHTRSLSCLSRIVSRGARLTAVDSVWKAAFERSQPVVPCPRLATWHEADPRAPGPKLKRNECAGAAKY